MLVALDNSGDFQSIQQAVDSIPLNNTKPVIIQLKKGIYHEKLRINKPFIHLIGEDPQATIINFADHAKKLLPSGATMNTLNSYSVYIGAPNFRAEKITFENSAGAGSLVGQAVAAYVDADRASFKQCRFIGCQDTLLTGPIPQDPPPVNINLLHPVLGYGKRITGICRQYYEDCYIQGDVDFIFGSATAVFNRCEISSNNRNQSINGYLTAASTPLESKFGFVFLDCQLTGSATTKSVYLGRPWRNHAKVAFINCLMGKHIKPEGWHNWDQPEREQTVTFAEFGSQGPGAHNLQRQPWARVLDSQEVKEYTVRNILRASDNWDPTTKEKGAIY